MSESPVARGRILVVDDDSNITDLIALYLEKSGFSTTTAADGYEADRHLQDGPFDLAVLDIMIPGPDGLELVRSLRRRGDLPVIIVSARASDVDKVAALHLGADDYLTKPFSPSELVARVESVLRRARRVDVAGSSVIRVGSLTIDMDSRLATVAGTPLALTPKEFELLAVFCRFHGSTLSRERLLDLVWGSNFYGVRSVDLHVLRLRKKLGGAGIRIETVWGSGYRLRGVEE